ncbi:MAG: hypothetical protein ACPGYT_06925 [Nitrospirales bacterium]
MPINALKKDTARGNGPPPTVASCRSGEKALTTEEKEAEAELATKEQEAMWESEEEGLTRWSESDGKRYGD